MKKDVKNGMKKHLSKYSWFYLIDLILNLVCTSGVLLYYKSVTISDIVVGIFNLDLAQFLIIALTLSILIICFIITFVLFIKSINQSNSMIIDTSVKRGVWVLPLVFLFLIQLSIAIPIPFTESKDLQPSELCSVDKFEKLQNEGNEITTNYSYQKNHFGKIVNLEQSAIIDDTEDANGRFLNYNMLDFNCYYRQSNYDSIYKKFEKFSDDYFEENKIERDGYIFYFEKDNDAYSCTLKIENENEYFVSKFVAYGDKAKCDYSQEQFISDSLSNYELWRVKSEA